MRKLELELIKEALLWVGTTEVGGDNHGLDVESWQRTMGSWVAGAPWCAAFAWSCAKKVSDELGIQLPVYKSANCMEIWHNSPKELRIEKPIPGCLIIWKLKNHPTAGHMGIVTKVLSDRAVMTVEGNTSPSGGDAVERNGDGVYQKQRCIPPSSGKLELVGFLRLWPEATEKLG